MYEEAIDSILGELTPGYSPGQARVNALRGNMPGSFGAGAGGTPGGPSPMMPPPQMPPPPQQAGPGGPGMGGPMPTPPGPLPGPPGPANRALPLATRQPPPLQPQAPGTPGGRPAGPLGATGSVMPLPPVAPVGEQDPLLRQADELYARHQQLLAEQGETYKPVDRGSMEQAFQKRQEGGNRSMLLALAAQQAGEGFEGVQQHALKQAAAAREPMKMTGGTMTGEGFIEDPGYNMEQQAKRADAKLKANESALAQNLTAQERRRLEIVHSQDKARHEQILLALGAQRAGAAGGGNDLKNWRIEDSLSKQFDGVTKDYTQEIDATRKLSALAPGRRPSAVEQGGMIMLVNKFLDPGSVVREGEYDRIAKQQGLLDRASNIIASLTRGEPLSDRLVADIRAMASLYEKAASGKIQAVGDEYAAKAARRGLDPTSIIVNPYYKHRETAAPQSGARNPAVERATAAPVRVNSKEEAMKLKPGTPFITPDGQSRVRQ